MNPFFNKQFGSLIDAPGSPHRGGDGFDPGPVDSQPVPRRGGTRSFPLSPAQRRVWFVEQLAHGAAVYNEADAARLTGDLQVDALEKAFNVIVGRHELLRSTITVSDGQPSFLAHDDWPMDFKTIDLGALSASDRESEIERLLVSEPRQPFNLETAPGIRATLVRLGPREHVLILMRHHLICDWLSVGVLWRELSESYRQILRNETLRLPPLPVQPGDYAARREAQYDAANYARDLAFWKETLRGAPELLELPADRPRPPSPSFRGARRRFRIESGQAEALRKLSRREKVSLFTVFAAALNVLFHRYTRSEDILLGIPLADRDRPELESMIGFLLHTQVLRTSVAGSLSFSALLGRVQKAVLEMLTHRTVPFELVAREVGQERALSYTPLFQVMLNWRDYEQDLSFIGLEGLKIESLAAESKTSKFDLTLFVTDDGNEILLEIEYSTDLFDEARIVRMAGHYQNLLAAAAADPGQKISDVPLLTEAEREQILFEWNRTEVDYPKGRYLPELIEAQVARAPDAVGVALGNRQLTYRALNARANQLARHLRKMGVGPDSLVAICVERSLEMVIGLLGVLKAGGAYVPLDPKYPRDRLAFVLKDANVQVLLTEAHLVETMAACGAPVLRLDADWPAMSAESEDNPASVVAGNNLAYVIYTSGSTGVPKGVEIPHEALVNFLLSMRERPGLTAQDVLVAVTTISFDIAGLEIFLPLITGARLVLLGPDEAADGFRLVDQLQASKATILQATPATWRILLDAKWPGNPRLKMLCGGEAMTRELADQLLAQGGELWNMYGPTETTVWSSLGRVARETPINIGRPIANTRIYLLDSQLQPVPVGVPGELHIGGTGLARGYHNRPELTAEKFIPDPFDPRPGARLYKTGDLARYLPNGNIECLGRLDHQVKIRGFRVELGEIEAVLNRQAGVRTSVVVAREDTPGDKRLTAYVVGDNGVARAAELRESLRVNLPEYMVPSAIVRLEALPLTPNGKVDRKALPKPDNEVGARSNFVAPGTPTEIVLAEVWREVLGLNQAGIHDSFFDLGGHSLLAVRLISKINKSLGLSLTVPAFFQNPTIKQLAAFLDQEIRDKRAVGSAPAMSPATMLVTLQTKGRRPPLFFLHGDWAGGGLYCSRLSAHLGDEQPFYVLPPYQSETRTVLTLEEMAARHLALVREKAPHGPYVLGGYCIGSVVAIEMARQLVAAGEAVGHLLLIDFPRVGDSWQHSSWYVIEYLAKIHGWNPETKMRLYAPYWRRLSWSAVDLWGQAGRWTLQKKIDFYDRHFLFLAKTPGSSNLPAVELPLADDADIDFLDTLEFAIYSLAYNLYRAPPVSLPATIYIPESTPPDRALLKARFSKLDPARYRLEVVPGNHETCLSKYSSVLAGKMREALEKVEIPVQGKGTNQAV
jgi:amino acid adenylation domain-containing protein